MTVKLRVHELSKTLGVPSKAIIEECQKRSLDVKNHMSVLDDSALEKLGEIYSKDGIARALQSATSKSVKESEAGPGEAVPKKIVRKKGLPKVVMAKGTDAKEPEAALPESDREVLVLEKGEAGRVTVEQTRVSSTIIRRRKQAPTTQEVATSAAPASPEMPSEATAGSESPTETRPVILAEAPPQATPSRIQPAAVAGQAPEQAAPAGKEPEAEKRQAIVEGEVKKPFMKEVEPEGYRESKRAAGYKKVRKVKDEEFRRTEYLKVGEEEDIYRPIRKKKAVARENKKTLITIPKASKRVIRMEGQITVADLAHRLQVKAQDVIKKLMSLGLMATVNQVLDMETVQLIAAEYHYEVQDVSVNFEDMVEERKSVDEKPEGLLPRPPVVTIMGHVDHGKTSLLDSIRQTNVAEGEFGGITQHIGAYQVEIEGKKICFVDTPGHEAFTAMRSRGAQVTDIIVLVVAAEEGVKPQTKEAIAHAQAAKVPIIVAINKIDKPEANPAMVRQQISNLGLVPEEWGGDTMYVHVSAKQKTGIKELLEHILLQAEVMELKANPNKRAMGIIVESRLDKGAGPVCTVIIKEGTLRDGDLIISGEFYGRVRALTDYQKRPLNEASPSTPVEVMGLDGVPVAGDKLYAMESEEKAREAAALAREKKEKASEGKLSKVSLEDLYARIQEGQVESLRVVLKADVQGSVEAIQEALKKVDAQEVKIEVVYSGVGAISDSDVQLAISTNAVVIGFNVRPMPSAKRMAEAERVSIKTYTIIYELLDEVQKAMVGLLKPEFEEVFVGRAEVRDTFKVSQIGTVAGCHVVEGKIIRNGIARLLRDHVQVYEGKIASLKRFKEDAREVTSGFECGIGFESFQDVKVGDVIEAFEKRAIAPVLTAKVSS